MTIKKYRDRSHSHDDDAVFTCEALTDEYAVVCPTDAFPEGNRDLGGKGTFSVGKSEFRVEGVAARKALLLEK